MKTHWPHSDAFLTPTMYIRVKDDKWFKFVKTFICTVGFAWIHLISCRYSLVLEMGYLQWQCLVCTTHLLRIWFSSSTL